MSVQEWIGIADNPRQRDTARHARKAAFRHLKTDSVTQRFVAAADLHGELIKLDGHTRALLWKDQKLAAPDHVLATIYHVDNAEDVKELYTHFDNAYASENATDRVLGAYHEWGVPAKSSLLQEGGITAAFNVILHTGTSYKNLVTTYDLVGFFATELTIIDSFDLPKSKFPGGVIAGMLVTVRVYGEGAMDFYVRYAQNKGNKIEQERDGVMALTDIVRDDQSRRSNRDRLSRTTTFMKTLAAFEADREQRLFTKNPLGLDLEKYYREHGLRLSWKDVYEWKKAAE